MTEIERVECSNTTCRRRAMRGRKMCMRCLESVRLANANLRLRRKADGLCYSCTSPTFKWNLCVDHYRRRRAKEGK